MSVKSLLLHPTSRAVANLKSTLLQTFDRSEGLLSKDNNFAVATALATYTHSKDLAIAQKNVAEHSKEGKEQVGFDFAIAEECQLEKECKSYTDVYDNLVFEIEYTDNEDADAVFQAACDDHGSTIAIVYRDRNTVPAGEADYHYEQC